MNLMMFPKMLASHDEGWVWLMRIHPSVLRMFAFYVVPMSMIPPAMLLYAAQNYHGSMLDIPVDKAWTLATFFYCLELVMVPIMGAVIQRIGEVVAARPSYHDAFAFAAVMPTPLWLSALALFVPNLMFNALIGAAALFGTGMLIYEGNYRIFGLHDEGRSYLLTSAVLAAGLVAWVVMMGLTLVSWGWAVS